MKIQIASIGGQVLPVLQGIVEFPCDQVILLHSNESKSIAEKIEKTIEGNFRLLELTEANDFFSIVQFCKNQFLELNNVSWFVNVSSGTKIMSLALFAYFKEQIQVETIFHIDQNGWVHSLITKESHQLKNYLPIEAYFLYTGQKVKSMTRFKSIDEESFEIKNEIKKFYAENNQEFLHLNKLYLNQFKTYSHKFQNFELINPRSHSTALWNKDTSELVITLFHKFNRRPYEFTFFGRESIGIAFEAKWFELEVAEILSKWHKSKELVWSLVVPYQDGQDKNEIDLIVNVGNKLLFVECKTQIYDIKDIDKFRNITKNYGGLGAKSILITYSKPHARFIEKCSDNNIILFYFRESNKQVYTDKDLYSVLDKEVIKTNPI